MLEDKIVWITEILMIPKIENRYFFNLYVFHLRNLYISIVDWFSWNCLEEFFFHILRQRKSDIDILFLFHLDLFSLSLRSENKFQVWTKNAIVPIILETPISFVNRFTNEYFIHMLEFFLWIFFTHYSSSPFKELYLICISKCSKKHFFFIFLVSFFF